MYVLYLSFLLKKWDLSFLLKFLKNNIFLSILHCNVHGSRVFVCTPMCCAVAVLNCSVISNSLQPHGLYPLGSSVHGDSPSKNTGVGCHVLLQGIVPIHRSNPSCIGGKFFTIWATREAHEYWSGQPIPSPGNLPNPGIKLSLLHCRRILLPAELPGKPHVHL